jgi:hypothetical protein
MIIKKLNTVTVATISSKLVLVVSLNSIPRRRCRADVFAGWTAITTSADAIAPVIHHDGFNTVRY